MLVYSRDSFDRCGERNHKGGGSPLAEITRHKPILKNRTPPDVEAAVVATAIEQPAWGQERVAEAVERRGPNRPPPPGGRRVAPPPPRPIQKGAKGRHAQSAQDHPGVTGAPGR